MTTIFFASHRPSGYTTEKFRHVFSQWYLAEQPFKGGNGIYDLAEIISTDDMNSYVLKDFTIREQYMILLKALIFAKGVNRQHNLQLADQIMQSSNPITVKSYGRKIKGFSDKIWDEWKFKVVVNGNYLQFSQNDKMKQILFSTGDREIVEASQKDNIWGIGYHETDAKKVDRKLWGTNLLGKAIMEVREKLK